MREYGIISEYRIIMVKTLIFLLPLLAYVLFTSCAGPSTPKIANHYSTIQARVYGCSLDTIDNHEEQILGLFIENNTKDTLYQLSGKLLLLDANTDTVAVFDFSPVAGDNKLTLCSAVINGQKLHSEDRFMIDPHNTIVETVMYAPYPGMKPGKLINALPDHYTCIWVMNK